MNSHVDKMIISILGPKKKRLKGIKYLAKIHRLVSGGFGLKHKTSGLDSSLCNVVWRRLCRESPLCRLGLSVLA